MRIVVSIIWFLVIFFWENLCYCLIKNLSTPLSIKTYGYVGLFAYVAYLLFRVLLSSFKSTFFELKLKEENGKEGTEKYLQWYLGKEPLVCDLLDIKYEKDNIVFPDNDTIIKYHYAENVVYETYANRRFWNIFCPFIRTDELTIDEIHYIICEAINLSNRVKDNSRL